jgi:hypothetical protein
MPSPDAAENAARNRIVAEIKALTLRLSEFGDVLVLVSYAQGDLTNNVVDGSGNWNTRIQMARAFVNRADLINQAQTEEELYDCEDEDEDDDTDDDDDKFHKSDCGIG